MKRSALKWFLISWLSFSFVACSEKNDPVPEEDENNLVSATLAGTRSAAEIQLLILLANRDIDPALFAYDVDIYKVIYKTTYLDSEIDASGLILLPKTNSPAAMLSFQHGTIVRQTDAPSLQSQGTLEVISYAAIASMGFITVVPDMIGFGASQEIFHPYYVEQPTASAVIHNLLAAKNLANEKQIGFNNKLFLAGYSQGGYATMAAHKALEEEPLEDFELTASFAGAGGYDIKALQEYFFEQETYSHPYYFAYIARSYQTYYHHDDLLNDFFNEPYASVIPTLFDGIKSPGQINSQLHTDISTLINENVLTGIDTDPQYTYLSEAFEVNSLVDWTVTVPLYLYHGDADLTVPYQNSVLTYEQLIANGSSSENLELITLPGADHSSGVEPYIADVIRKLQVWK